MKKQQMIKFIAGVACFIMMVMFISPVTANADMGPKPSLRIMFENMGDELCYGTLLSERESTGPYSAWNGNEKYARHNENPDYSWESYDYEIWKAFVEYEDADGYFFLQESWNVSEEKKMEWTYYPPSRFKILLYYPETETFVSSGIYERYAFDTYYTVDMDGIAMHSVQYDEDLSTDKRIEAHRSYQYGMEIATLIIRIILTILIEMGVALIFGFREKKQLFLLAGVNVATQIILNVLLNVINFNLGQMAFGAFYLLLEAIVFVIEAVVYCIWMKRLSKRPKAIWVCILYALVANAVSYGVGFQLAVVSFALF